MAKIIVSFHSVFLLNQEWQVSVFYEGFIDELRRQGNDVMVLISNDFICGPWNGTNELLRGIDRKKLDDAIRSFDPDIVFAFNNSTLRGLEDKVECPFILWRADSFSYFNDKDIIKLKEGRYLFFSFSRDGIEEYKEFIAPGKGRLFHVSSATGIHASKVEKRDNISFIGTYFIMDRVLWSLLSAEPRRFAKLMRQYEQGTCFDLDRCLRELGLENHGITLAGLRGVRAGELRNQTIAAVAPLGIRIFGTPNWKSIGEFSVDSALGYDRRLAYSLEHNESIYNRSRIAISVSHSQNVTGYPWRVQDIMASDACLVSDRRSELEQDFGAEVPLQLYDSPWEAFEVCRRLLEDEELRRDVVAASNAVIERGHRWHHRLRDIEQICGVQLCHSGQAGAVTRLDPLNFLKSGVLNWRWLDNLAVGLVRAIPSSVRWRLLTLNNLVPLGRLLSATARAELRSLLIQAGGVEIYED